MNRQNNTNNNNEIFNKNNVQKNPNFKNTQNYSYSQHLKSELNSQNQINLNGINRLSSQQINPKLLNLESVDSGLSLQKNSNSYNKHANQVQIPFKHQQMHSQKSFTIGHSFPASHHQQHSHFLGTSSNQMLTSNSLQEITQHQQHHVHSFMSGLVPMIHQNEFPQGQSPYYIFNSNNSFINNQAFQGNTNYKCHHPINMIKQQINKQTGQSDGAHTIQLNNQKSFQV